MSQHVYETAIIGGGIVGLATARALCADGVTSLVVLEAEEQVATHQTGHNSGVIHSGLYYKPGSLKARNCATGREAMYRFCAEHGLPHKRCGKIVVATTAAELPALEELQRRGLANGLQNLRWLEADELKEFEPHVRGIAGLHVQETGVVNFRDVAKTLAVLVEQAGGVIRCGSRLQKVRRLADTLVLETAAGAVECRNLINCAGLQADRVARLCGVPPGVQIVPFRGEYYELVPERAHLVRGLIYPVPDSRFPFLGVHFTRGIDDTVEAGPNAVLALRREGYTWSRVSPRDLAQMLCYRGFWRMAWKYGRLGLAEMYRSLNRAAFLHAMQKLIPDIQDSDIRRAGSGVRAQALGLDGKLVDDYHIVPAERMIHVLNAPSPAATSSLSIGQSIADLAREQGHWRRTTAASVT